MNRDKKQQKTRMLPNALIISANTEKSFADILKKVKQDFPEEVEDTIDRVRWTTMGQLLIVFNRRIGDRMGPLQKRISALLKDGADIISKIHEVELHIRF